MCKTLDSVELSNNDLGVQMSNKHFQHFLSPVLGVSMAMLVGCGGGSSSSSDSNDIDFPDEPDVIVDQPDQPKTPLTASFAGSLFERIEYRSGDVSGTIHSNGSFQYKEGEDVRFSIAALPWRR